jgi:hypothetical protein
MNAAEAGEIRVLRADHAALDVRPAAKVFGVGNDCSVGSRGLSPEENADQDGACKNEDCALHINVDDRP